MVDEATSAPATGSDAGRIVALWRKRGHGVPMDALLAAELVAGRGMVGNRHQGGFRQLTVIAEEAWEAALAELGGGPPDASPAPTLRRANVLVAGIDLAKSRGRILRLGACRLWILGETRPCRQMDEALPGLRHALEPDWRGGVFGQVLSGGPLTVGDAVAWDGYQAPRRLERD